jgi:hypothetical protein
MHYFLSWNVGDHNRIVYRSVLSNSSYSVAKFEQNAIVPQYAI